LNYQNFQIPPLLPILIPRSKFHRTQPADRHTNSVTVCSSTVPIHSQCYRTRVAGYDSNYVWSIDNE
jgi:hypothetical protein